MKFISPEFFKKIFSCESLTLWLLSDADLFSCLQHKPSSAAHSKARQLQSASDQVLETFCTFNLGAVKQWRWGLCSCPCPLDSKKLRLSWEFQILHREKAAKKGQKKDNRSSFPLSQWLWARRFCPSQLDLLPEITWLVCSLEGSVELQCSVCCPIPWDLRRICAPLFSCLLQFC